MTIPLPEDFAIRPVKMGDIEAVVELVNVCSVELIGEPRWETRQLRTYWESESRDVGTDLQIVFAPGGQLVGYADVWNVEPYVQPRGWVNVHPDYKGRGIGSYLAQWVEERARQTAYEAPEDARVWLRQMRPSTDTAARALLLQQGYQIVRHDFHMLIEMEADVPPPEPVIPPGITIRPIVFEKELETLVRTCNAIFRDHWGHIERPFEELYKGWLRWIDATPGYDSSLWFLALDGDEIVGMSLCCPTTIQDPEMGRVDSLGVQRRWRRRGLALALLRHSFRVLHQRGKRKVSLEVDTQSLTGATRLYEKVGMHLHRQTDTYEKELRPGKDLRAQSVESGE